MRGLPAPARTVEFPPQLLPSNVEDPMTCFDPVDALFGRMQQSTRIVQEEADATTKQQSRQQLLLHRALEATYAKITAAEEETNAIQIKVRDARARATDGLVPQISVLRQRLNSLNQSDRLITAERALEYRQETEAWKHKELAHAMEQDRMLASQELELAYEALKDCESELCGTCTELEVNERSGASLETNAAQLSVRTEQVAVQLTNTLTECDAIEQNLVVRASTKAEVDQQLRHLDATADQVKLETLEALARLSRVCARAVQQRKDCGHQNPKQKIHKMLQIELENLDLRKENFELRTRLVHTVQNHYRRIEFEEPTDS